jgi:hypothetical protein
MSRLPDADGELALARCRSLVDWRSVRWVAARTRAQVREAVCPVVGIHATRERARTGDGRGSLDATVDPECRLPQGNLPAARAFASYASGTVRLAPRGWLRSDVARNCRGCRHGLVRAVRPRLNPGGGHRGAVEETGGLTAVRCSCGAVLSGAMVLDQHQTRAAERRLHPASACGALRSPTRAGGAFGLTRNRASRAAGSRHASVLPRRARHRIILFDEGDQIVRTRPRPEATDNPPHKCASPVKRPFVPHGFWNVRFRIAERNRRRFGPYGRM